jgi:hypothetical protein
MCVGEITIVLASIPMKSHENNHVLSYLNHHWLVVWNIFYFSHHIGNVIIPTDELHHFSEGWRKTTNQTIFHHFSIVESSRSRIPQACAMR